MQTTFPPARSDLPLAARPAAHWESRPAAAQALRPTTTTGDEAQRFVARLRASAAAFAVSAAAQTAVVQEVVPPARHRRSRCRIVLWAPDGRMSDLTFLGAPGHPEAGFAEHILRWLEQGEPRSGAWLVPDEDAADGTAIDLTSWLRHQAVPAPR